MVVADCIWEICVCGPSPIWCVRSPLAPSPTDDVRLYGFVRITTGDAMSKRAKFTLITWIGENVSGLQRAKISTDKTLVKDIVQVIWVSVLCCHFILYAPYYNNITFLCV